MPSITLATTITRAGCVFDGTDKSLHRLQNNLLLVRRQIARNLTEKILKAGLNPVMRFPAVFRECQNKGSGIGDRLCFVQKAFGEQRIQQTGRRAFFHGQKRVQIRNLEFFVFGDGIQDDKLMKSHPSAEGGILPATSRRLRKPDENIDQFDLIILVLFHNGCNMQLYFDLSREKVGK